MSGSDALVPTLQKVVQAINALNQTIAETFPQALGTTSTATGGAATLPAAPVGFISVKSPTTGEMVKIPYYL